MSSRRSFLALPLLAQSIAAAPASRDRREVRKTERQLTLFTDGELSHRFRIRLGFAPEGHTLRQGDGRAPEGHDRTALRNADMDAIFAPPVAVRVAILPYLPTLVAPHARFVRSNRKCLL